MYEIQVIERENEIDKCNKFEINHYQWTNTRKPKAFGKVGCIQDKGIFVKLTCEESNPKKECDENKKRICDDSAMEVFFSFVEEGEELTNDSMYINFEMNANGMLYAKYGKGRKGRQFISDEMYQKSQCHAEVFETSWTVEVLIPKEFIDEIYSWNKVINGQEFYCNFYKISEDPQIEHYGSFKKINSETPNFHLPVSFAKTRVI